MRKLPALAAAAVLGLTACSQAAALAPVGGDRLAEVRFAAIDVLLAQHVDLLEAPVCTASGADDATISCRGTTVDAKPVTVTSSAGDQADMTVVVGTDTVFTGSVADVLDRNAQPS